LNRRGGRRFVIHGWRWWFWLGVPYQSLIKTWLAGKLDSLAPHP
jgi:hypothetical protein